MAPVCLSPPSTFLALRGPTREEPVLPSHPLPSVPAYLRGGVHVSCYTPRGDSGQTEAIAQEGRKVTHVCDMALVYRSPLSPSTTTESSMGSVRLNPPVTPAGVRLFGFDPVVDTGLRMDLNGRVAVLTTGDQDVTGISCERCGRITMFIRAWNRCENCGNFLLSAAQENLPPSVLRVDWSTGFTHKQAVTCPTSTTSNSGTRRGRGRGLLAKRYSLGLAKEPRPGPTTSSSEGETSGVMSGGVTASDNRFSVSELIASLPSLSTSSRSWSEEGASVAQPASDWDTVPPDECVSSQYAAVAVSDTHANLHRDPSPAEAVCSEERGRLEHRAKGIHRPITAESPPRTEAQIVAQKMSYAVYVRRSPKPCVLPGCGDDRKLSKLSRLQRIIHKKVAMDYGLDFPYVSEEFMEMIEDNRERWYHEAIWDFLGVPKPVRNQKLDPLFHDKFNSCLETWRYGRYIFKDKVVIKRPEREDIVRSVTSLNSQGESVTLPDPGYYK